MFFMRTVCLLHNHCILPYLLIFLSADHIMCYHINWAVKGLTIPSSGSQNVNLHGLAGVPLHPYSYWLLFVYSIMILSPCPTYHRLWKDLIQVEVLAARRRDRYIRLS
jgi:hypothetical protein